MAVSGDPAQALVYELLPLVYPHVSEELSMFDDSSCGGWSVSGPPCGGCGECLRAQFMYCSREYNALIDQVREGLRGVD